MMRSHLARQEGRSKEEGIKIREVPRLTSPERISQLNFSFGDIRVVPAHIVSARNLQMLDLSHNKISKIEYVCAITSLKFINLSYNIISQLPNDLLHLAEIQNIDLSFNKITLLSSIKVLKRLVQMRTFEKNGFIEVNLEGNEVLKKKGCKDICKKWLSPSIQQYSRQAFKEPADGYIHLTKKRNSKSLEVPLRDSSMLLTHRTHHISQKMEQTRFFEGKSRKMQQKVGSALKHSVQITQKLSPKFLHSEEQSNIKEDQLIVKSQILNGVHSFHDLSKVFQSTVIQNINNLGEWFCVCIDELNDLGEKFMLLTSNEDTNSLQEQIKSKIHDECNHARQIIMICLELMKETIDNKLGKESQEKYLKQIISIDGKIKAEHNFILKEMANNNDVLPIRLYKLWVTLYRKLKSIIYQFPDKISNHRLSYARQLQIQELQSISPDKKNQLLLPSNERRLNTYKNDSSQKPSASKEKLDELLFSKNKSECLLLSDQKDARASSQKKSPKREGGEQCQNCLMLKWVSSKHKDEIAELSEKVRWLQTSRGQQLQVIANLQKFKMKYLNMASKQELIIGELEYLKPSTYQNVLLEQAKTIEYMLRTSELVDYNKLGNRPDPLHQYSSKQIVKDKDLFLNTRLTSTNNNLKASSSLNKVSEFSIEGKVETTKQSSNTVRGSSYFKNKNSITTVNRTNEDPKTQIIGEYLISEQNKPKESLRQEIVVSQFNSHLNSHENTSDKNKNITFQQFSTEKDNQIQENARNKRKVTEKSSKMENDVILISQGSEIKNVSLSKLETLKPNHKEDKNKMFLYLKSEQFNQILRSKLKNTHEKPKGFQIQRVNSLQEQPVKQPNQRKSSQKKHSRMSSEQSDKQNVPPNSQNLKRNKTAERFYQDNPSQDPFIPMQSTEAENYKKYVKYHLRNNIIEILFKKSNGAIDQAQEKLVHYTKTQKLINKRNTNNSQRSQLEEGLSKSSQANKTFR